MVVKSIKSIKSFLQEDQVVCPDPTIHPFFHRFNLTMGQKIQIIVMSITIAPVRLIFASFFFFLTWAWAYLITTSMKSESNEPFGTTYARLLKVMRCLARLTLFCVGFHRITVKGEPASQADAPVMVAAPHSSLLDTVVFFVCKEIPSTVSRYENSSAMFSGTILKAMRPVLVLRQDQESRRKSADEIARRAQSGGKWPQTVIFPEGTCTNRKVLIGFKAGGFACGAPVQPIGLRFPNRLDTLSWVENGPCGRALFWLTLCQFQTKCEVHCLPVYNPSDKEQQDPTLFAENVRKVIADQLDLPCTEHTFDDCRLMRQAKKLGLSMEVGLVEYYKLRRNMVVNMESLFARLSEFACITNGKSSGTITIEDLASFLRSPITPTMKRFFSAFDKEGKGQITFRDYILGLSLYSPLRTTETSIKQVFDTFNKSGCQLSSADIALYNNPS